MLVPTEGPLVLGTTLPMMVNENQRSEVLLTPIARSMTTGGGKPGQGYPAVLVAEPLRQDARPLVFDTTQITSAANRSRVEPGMPCHTLPANGHAPAIAFTTEQTPKFNVEQALTLTKQSPSGGGQVQCVMTTASPPAETIVQEFSAYAGNAEGSTGLPFLTVSNVGKTVNNQTPLCVTGSITHTLTAEGFDASEDGTGRGNPIVAPTDTAVRRLMPVETEALMGWARNWTAYGVKPNGARYALADGPRYRLCGNGWVRQCVLHIATRLLLVDGLLR